METDTKLCSICKEKKPLEQYFRNKKAKDGRKTCCKLCHMKEVRAWQEKNSTKTKKYREKYEQNNTEKRKESKKKYKDNNIEKIRESKRKYLENNIEKVRESKRKYLENNKEKRKESSRKYNRKARSIPQNRIRDAIGGGISKAIKENKANRRWETLVGYTIGELMIHLESLFTPEMNWGNYGSYWHIDHIKPQSWFIYENAEDEGFKMCWALSNLQPLEASKNCSKRNKYEGGRQSSDLEPIISRPA